MKNRLTTNVLTSITLLLTAVSLGAATVTVTNTNDAGSGSLRQAILDASPNDSIVFDIPTNDPGYYAPTGVYTINLTSGRLAIGKKLTISGPGANLLSVQHSGSTEDFVFEIITFVNATISGLTIANGSNGGVFNLGTLTLTSVTLSGNVSVNLAGAIFNGGSATVTLSNSTVSGNSANAGGGIYNLGVLTLVNSTVSGNSARVDTGGGIFNLGTVTLTNSTIAANSAVGGGAGAGGGGIANFSGTVNARNTIIALNTATLGSPDFFGTLTSQGYNLIGDTSFTMITGTTTGNQLNVNPLLGPLQDNGGPTFTQALSSGSPAIEGGSSSGSNTDQRGLARPVDSPVINNATDGDGSDIGAYEVQADQLPGCSDINRIVTNNNDSGPGSLRAIIASVCAGSTITFAPSVTGAIDLTSGELFLNKSLTINGPGANSLSVQRSADAGTADFRIFNIAPASVRATISGLRVANGNAAGLTFGGGVYNAGTLTLANTTISDNSGFGGGGIYNEGGTVTLTSSTLSGNSAVTRGSGIFNMGTATVLSSTISGNSALGGNGGGLINNGTLTLTNSTVSGNSATGAGGGLNNLSGTVTSKNTIIALNTAASNPDLNGSLTSAGFNLIGDNSGAVITPAQFSDQIGTAGLPIDPLLGPLQNNGGPTFTQALLTGSPALDNGNSSGSVTDQRGLPRPDDDPAVANGDGSDGSDIGAFELQSAKSPTPTPTPTKLGNISTRLGVEGGDSVLIGGFIITGTEPKEVIVRAIGPSLPLAGALADPLLELYDGMGLLITSNDNWMNASNKQAIIDSGLAPANDLESAILMTLEPAAYTAILRGKAGITGIGLIEAYDLDQAADAKLANISTRGLVQTGDNVMIGGFILLGTEAQEVLVRGIGPSLADFGVPGVLSDPTVELYDSSGTLLVSNDDWKDSHQTEIAATGLAPSKDKESAILITLAPAAYTAIVRGQNNTTGVALVEVYELN
jgi:hypothetical protein